MTMHEGERLAYLQALGITQYVPLQPIAGALQLPEWVVKADESLAQESPVQADAIPDASVQEAPPQSVVESVSALVQKTDTTPLAQPTAIVPLSSQTASSLEGSEIPQLDVSKLKPAEEVSRAPTTKPVAQQRFSLAVITLPHLQTRLLVELARHDAPGLSGVEFRLLGDLLRALNAQQELSEGALRFFRWPLVNNPRIAADASAARDGLLAFLGAAQSEQPVEKLVFLGSAALSCFPHQQTGNVFNLPDVDNAACLFTHSLTQAQQDWSLKPVLWCQLHAFL